jgi:hypothetical protein
MKTDRNKLLGLQKRLEEERGRILADPDALAAGERLPARLIRELADIDLATRAVAAELARHTPRRGYGSET